MKKLNFGCGSIQPEDWINIDNDPAFNTDIRATLIFEDNYFDVIVAHCSLQMVEYPVIVNMLRELYRLLKPGGVLRISLPDIVKGFEAYKKDDINWFPNGEEKIDDRFSAWLTWYSTSKTLLTEHSLVNKLIEAGFLHIAPASFKDTICEDKTIVELDTREGECYFMEAKK